MKKYSRQKFVFGIVRWPCIIFFRLKFGFVGKRFKQKDIKLPYLILSNHVSLLDPVMLSLSFPYRGISFIASDFIFDKTLKSRLLRRYLSPISTTKGMMDVAAVKEIMTVRNNKGIVGIFPSGNTTYSGREAFINIATAKLARKLGVPLLLYRFDGLYGIDPRWGGKVRRGKSEGAVRRVLTSAEIQNISDDELIGIIRGTLETPTGRFALSKYKSRRRAEYLERVLFVCPMCNHENGISTDGNFIICDKCGSKLEYTQELKFKGEGFDNKTVREWFDFQLQYIKGKEKFDFSDESVTLYIKPKFENRIKIAFGSLKLNGSVISVGDKVFQISTIRGACIQNKNKLLLYHDGDMYLMIGGKRTNFYKYFAGIVMQNNELRQHADELLGL